MGQEQEMLDLDKIEVAVAQLLPQRCDDAAVARTEHYLMQAIEERRLFEQWRRGVALRLVFGLFVRTDDRIELRAKLHEERTSEGVGLRDSNGMLRRWTGPGHPGAGKMLTADDL
jgi:hypothetical protein